MLEFYTTAEQERFFEEEYQQLLKVKQAEIDAHPTQPQKFTARAHIHQPHRIFVVSNDGTVSLRRRPCPTGPVPGGGTYSLDTAFTAQILAFQKAHPEYTVTFIPSGRYGPCVYYCGAKRSVMPASLIAPSGEKLVVEDEDKYDIGCG